METQARIDINARINQRADVAEIRPGRERRGTQAGFWSPAEKDTRTQIHAANTRIESAKLIVDSATTVFQFSDQAPIISQVTIPMEGVMPQK